MKIWLLKYSRGFSVLDPDKELVKQKGDEFVTFKKRMPFISPVPPPSLCACAKYIKD